MIKSSIYQAIIRNIPINTFFLILEKPNIESKFAAYHNKKVAKIILFQNFLSKKTNSLYNYI